MLQLAIPKVQAWEVITDHEKCAELTMEGFYTFLVEAGYSEEVAQKTANQRGWDRLNAGMQM